MNYILHITELQLKGVGFSSFASCHAVPTMHCSRNVQDTATTVPQARWYDASKEEAWLNDYIDSWQGPLQEELWCIDLFGASEIIKNAWESQGFKAASFDLLIGGSECLRRRHKQMCLVDGCHVVAPCSKPSVGLPPKHPMSQTSLTLHCPMYYCTLCLVEA